MVNDGKALDEAAKVSHHLSLLRDEYNKLQARYAELLRQVGTSQVADPKGTTFLQRLLKFVGSLYQSDHLSDVKIMLAHRTVPGHRFVLTARSDNWLADNKEWEDVSELDLTHFDAETGDALLHWIYNDELKVPTKQLDFLIRLLKAAGQYRLCDLISCCEQLLIPMVNVTNCVNLFVRAEESGADNLRTFCASLMSSHWEDLDRDNLAPLSAQSLYRLLEEHSSYPLHGAIRLGREGVVFLDLIKYTQQVRDSRFN